jgi:hypothetical protein
MDLKQRSMIRYYALHRKWNTAIWAKLSLVYGKDALCQRIVDTWAARFRNRITSVEDDERPGRPCSDSLSDAISGYLNKNPHTSCRKIANDLFIPRTTILRILDEMGLRFFVARWVPYKLSPESKAKRIEICREMLEVLERLNTWQKSHVITGDECCIYWDNYHCGQ